jgi:uncharacterized protein (TIGR02147 family)
LRAFARDMELAPSRLSEIFNGKQGLSRQAAEKVAEKLGYSDSESTHFCDLVASLHARSHAERELAKVRLVRHRSDSETMRLKVDTFHMISDWYHLAILELTSLKFFVSDNKWIAKSLGISEVEAQTAIDRLERLGFIEWRDGKIISTENRTFTPGGIDSESIKKFHKQILEKAIDSIYLQPLAQREQSALVIGIDSKKLPLAKEKIKEFWREFCKDIDSTEQKDNLYCLTIQFFSLLEGAIYDTSSSTERSPS